MFSKKSTTITKRLFFISKKTAASNLRFLYTFTSNEQTDNLLKKSENLKSEISKNYDSADVDLKLTIHQKLRGLWTYHSNAIEGSTLSLGDTIFFLREGITVGGKPLKDFLDAKNHAEAIDFMYEIITQKRPIDPNLIKYINYILLSGVSSTPAVDPFGRLIAKPLTPGDYKKMPNHVLQPDGKIHRYVEPLSVPAEMGILFEWIEENHKICHPIITASIAHYNMVRIHPFDDGNGRGARILMNLILLREQYIPAVIKIEDRKDYINSLTLADNGDINPFICFIAKSLIWTQEMILNEIKKYSTGMVETHESTNNINTIEPKM